jgi:glycosyltransferase involved in cell wall biosynthesis
MDENKKIKILWLCYFSNSEVREKLHPKSGFLEVMARKVLRMEEKKVADFAQWITNGIKEFEKFNNVELHVVSPQYGITEKKVMFEQNGIHYYFYKPDDSLVIKFFRKLFNNYETTYKGNRKITKEFINKIQPDIIHLYGAENYYYSITGLDIDIHKYPFMVTLQTLTSEPDFKIKDVISGKQYEFRAKIESAVLRRVKYIASSVPKYREIIWQDLNQNAIFLNSFLAVSESISVNNTDKKFDFVSFSASIHKAADFAIEAFAIACKKYPELTLNIIGGTPEPFTQNLKSRINELGIDRNVFFSGKLPTHDDVLKQIQLSKYALLPLKIDFISGTIREAMFAGLPVVTTITHGTPTLNEKRKSVLLSEQGDFQAMAENVIKLIESPTLASELTENGLLTVRERWNNERDMLALVEAYKALFNHHHNGIPIPREIGSQNPTKNA